MEAQAVDGLTGELLRHLRGKKRLLVLSHANPDPDAIASAMGLRQLAGAAAGLPSTFAFAGRIMRAENRELVRTCGIEMVPQDSIDPDSYDCLALVDSQPGFGHTTVPDGRAVDIVVDHHVPPDQSSPTQRGAFHDVRTYVGATSSMVTGYLMDARVDVPRELATALFYGIRTDTADLSRNASPLDEQAYDFLVSRVDRQALARIATPDLSPEYYRTLRVALSNVRIYGDLVLCSLGKITAPEMVAEVADLLLRLEGKQTVFCGGLVDQLYYVSLRTELNVDAYYLLAGALDGAGSFGGHGTLAGGCIPLPSGDRRTLKRLERRLERNILATLGLDGVTVAGLGGGED
jgi:nanoRNase/pAp phosphatase (c-di-AMP/oligoRNAs hydrolase)